MAHVPEPGRRSLENGGVIMQRIRNLVFRRVWEAIHDVWYFTKSDVFYVKGRFLRDNERRKVILRGINLPLLDDWAFPGTDKLAELEKTGANAVRIQWYMQYPQPKYPWQPKRPAY